MDKHSLTGMALIAAILLGYSYFFAPEEQDKQKQVVQTSAIERVEGSEAYSNNKLDSSLIQGDSVINVERFITLQNELIEVTISNRGGRVFSAKVKGAKSWDGDTVQLFNGNSNSFGWVLPFKSKNVNTNDELFQVIDDPFMVSSLDSNSVTMRLMFSPGNYIDYIYSLEENSYLLDYKVNMVGVNQLLAPNTKDITLNWTSNLIGQEKNKQNEQGYTTVYYQTADDDVDYLSESSDDKENVKKALNWVSFKQQFFSSVLIADVPFANAHLVSKYDNNPDSQELKNLSAELSVPFGMQNNETYGFKFFFGPNLYPTLKDIGYDLQNQVNLGWGPLGWINRFAVIPIFTFLSGFGLNYGVIIILLTLILKLVLLPATYSSYISQAKMRILKPEMDEIKAKVGEDDQARLQQEYMKLYKQAGVNPLAGCVPLLLQMPILLAFFQVLSFCL